MVTIEPPNYGPAYTWIGLAHENSEKSDFGVINFMSQMYFEKLKISDMSLLQWFVYIKRQPTPER